MKGQSTCHVCTISNYHTIYPSQSTVERVTDNYNMPMIMVVTYVKYNISPDCPYHISISAANLISRVKQQSTPPVPP